MSEQSENMATDAGADAVSLATELTIAWLSNPNTRAGAEEVPAFLRTMHEAVGALAAVQGASGSADAAEAPQEFVPAVSVRKSLASRDSIISMIDGKPYKTLRRHLAGHGLTPETYRERYGLKADYPMVAPDYSEARRSMAKKIGLGRKPKSAAASSEQTDTGPAEAPKKRGKLGIAAAKAHLGSEN
ncbi:MucR family transcriptional regulator (plasmid) [Sphingomonas zeae]